MLVIINYDPKYLFLQECIKGCSFYKDCVRCKIFGTGPISGDCEKQCNATITKVGDVESCKFTLAIIL